MVLNLKAQAQLKCNVSHYNTEHGLSHNRETFIHKDKEGFIWAASWDGLNRFDGSSFISYKSFPGDRYGLAHDRVDVITEDEKGILWLKGLGEIYKFDKKTEQFSPLSAIISELKEQHIDVKNVSFSKGNYLWVVTRTRGIFLVNNISPKNYKWFRKADRNRNLPSDTINFLHQDKLSNVWVGTTAGAVCFVKNKTGQYKKSNHQLTVPGKLNIRDVDEDSGNIYFSTTEGYVVIFSKKTRRTIIKKIANKSLIAIRKSLHNSSIFCTTSQGDVVTINLTDLKAKEVKLCDNIPIISIYQDRTGNLWLEPDTKGIIRFNIKTGASKWFGESHSANRNPSSFYSVFEDENGTIWLNMKGGGFGYYNAKYNRIDQFYEEGFEQHKFPDLVYNLYYDKSGIIWLCTENGIDKILLHNNNFLHQPLVENSTLKVDNQVRSIFSDRKNRVWMGSKSGTLTVFDINKRLTNLFINKPSGGLGPVYCVAQDRGGVIWIGTKFNGLFKAEPINKEETKYKLTHYDKANSNLSSNDIYSIFEDNAGRLWIGTMGGGPNLLSNINGKTFFYNTKNAFRRYPKEGFNQIRYITSDKNGMLWMTSTDGLLLMNATGKNVLNPEFKIYKKQPGDEKSLGDNDIQFVSRDYKNRMWLSTSGGGLALAIGNNPLKALSFKTYTRKDGLPSDFPICSIQDKIGNLWIATQNGLSRFNIKKNSFTNYRQNYGLPNVGFSEASCAVTNDGTIYFGTAKGFLTFNPARIDTKKTSPNIVFTSIQINNEDINIGSGDSLLDLNVNYVRQLKLEYNQNIVGIDYAILDYRGGAKQDFLYRLSGLSDTWINDKARQRVTYTNLAPGEYLFQVKSVNDEFYSNIPLKELRITILPPPWRSWWAYVLYLIVACILGRIAFRIARTILRLRQDITIEKRMANLKVSFFTNVSHELRTPLTLILNPIEEIERREVLSDQGKAYIQVVRRNARRMVRFMDQWLDLRKIQSGKQCVNVSNTEVVSLVRSIGEYFIEILREKNIELQISSNVDELYAWIDVEKIDIVIYNLLSNAFKYSPEGKKICIKIDCQSNLNKFFIEVTDEGAGVPEEKLNQIFALFYSEDVERVQNATDKGIGIGLALSQELVDLHHGKISARNNQLSGLTVSLELRLGKDHFDKSQVKFIDSPNLDSLHSQISEHITVPVKEQLVKENKPDRPLVLLVEDNNELRNILKTQLGEFYNVEVAYNGQDGLEKALILMPDLILSDVMMPVLNGIQLLEKLKNDERTSHIPVILLSAKASIESQIEGLKYGADYYITKPFSSDFLMAALENLMKRRKEVFNSLLGKKAAVDLSPGEIVFTSKDEDFLKKVIDIVEKGMIDPEFNIDKVAEAIGLGRTTFYNKFKSLTNITTVEFVREMRLKRAKQYLDAGETNISTVAYSVGFNNPKYFSTCFKEMYKISPKEYVKSREDCFRQRV
ncbi:two-component regulator propeller domain-containing protein [Pedobacter sp. P351]|uniref:hybrid sensor histidine kinase/response regulator transcription factor n=1 Tax=Pedobacter superstes TaxID=3133441 RepID=UPI0030A053D0